MKFVRMAFALIFVAALAACSKEDNPTAPSSLEPIVVKTTIIVEPPPVATTNPNPDPGPSTPPTSNSGQKVCKLLVDPRYNTTLKAQNDAMGATSVNTQLGDLLNSSDCSWEAKSLTPGWLTLYDGPIQRTNKPITGTTPVVKGRGSVHFWAANNGSGKERTGSIEFTCKETGEKYIFQVVQAG